MGWRSICIAFWMNCLYFLFQTYIDVLNLFISFGKARCRAVLLGPTEDLALISGGQHSKSFVLWCGFSSNYCFPMSVARVLCMPHSRIAVFPMEKLHLELSYWARRKSLPKLFGWNIWGKILLWWGFGTHFGRTDGCGSSPVHVQL